MNFPVLIFLVSFIVASGQKCKLPSGKTGYCREKGDCADGSQEDCQSGFTCCENSEKSLDKCMSYGKYVYKTGFQEALTLRPSVHNVSQCSIAATPLIIGGSKAEPKEFPHMFRVKHLKKALETEKYMRDPMDPEDQNRFLEIVVRRCYSLELAVAIGFGDDIEKAVWFCGGSLISENFVLTAAHCSNTLEWGPAKFVRMGIIKVKNVEHSRGQDFLISEIFIHPKHKSPSRYNDIALFRISGSVEFNEYVRPACLYRNSDEFSLKKGTATGWGKLDYYANEGSQDLMKVDLDFVDYSKCNSSLYSTIEEEYISRGIITSQFCAGNLEGGKDTCHGDSGGPFQVVLDEPYCMYSIVGITSFGNFCGFKNSPAVYTRVSYFVPWIESVVWP